IAALDYVSHGDLGLHRNGALGTAHLPPQILPQLLLPYVFGPIFDFGGRGLQLTQLGGSVGGYLDTSRVLCALLGRFSGGRRGLLVDAAVAALAIVAAAAIGAGSLIGELETRFNQRPYFPVAVAWGAVVVLAAAAAMLVRPARLRVRLLAALVAVDACALFV